MNTFQIKFSSVEKLKAAAGFVHHLSLDFPLDETHPLHKNWNASPEQHMALLAEQPSTAVIRFDKTKYLVAMNWPSLVQRSYHPNGASDSHPNAMVDEINQMAIVDFVEMALHEQKSCDFYAHHIHDWVTYIPP